MGSITSFPFLCLANAAMCRWALEISNKVSYRCRDKPLTNKTMIAPLLINGDDCTMKGNRSNARHLWTTITSFGGLTSSLGKTLFSLIEKPITVINSQTFDYVDNHWVTRKYVNLGILMSKPRSGMNYDCKETKRPYHVLGTMHRELKKSSPESIWCEVSKRFIHYNRDTLDSVPEIPWTAPEYLGGPGLIPVDEISELDRGIMTVIIMLGKHSNYEVGKYKTATEWKLDEIVQKQMKSQGYEPKFFRSIRKDDSEELDLFGDWDSFREFHDPEDGASRLYKYMVAENIFTGKAKADGGFDFFIPKNKDVQVAFDKYNKKILKHNRESYLHASYKYKFGLLPSNFKIRSTEELMYEKKESSFLVWGSLNEPGLA